jgi:aminoglycoside phosphotransferase (APT) family kinase protein
MRALWGSPLRSSGAVAIAEPLALVRDPEVLIQRAVPGRATFLDRLEAAMFRDAFSSEDREHLRGLLGTIARGLVDFHACGARVPAYGWQDEMAEVRGRVARLSGWVPGLDAALCRALDRLAGLASAAPAPHPVTSHGSFRPRQVMLDGDRIAFIDTDGCCEAEPAMDLALFRASMKTNVICSDDGEEWTARSSSWRSAALEELDALGDHFLDEYERRAPVSRSRVALWETLYLLENLLNTWEKIRPGQLQSSEVLLERHLRRSRLPIG